jgi:signal peptidase I
MKSVALEGINPVLEFLWFTTRMAGVSLLLAAALKATVIEAFFVPSTSMAPTLQTNDYILVPKLSYGLHIPLLNTAVLEWQRPNRGDIVVFTRMDDESGRNFVKRVVALPGETVEIVETAVFVDGELRDEPYARWARGGISRQRFGPITVPEGQVFLLGDNRDESKDSRFWSYPFVDMKRIKGKALMVYWSRGDHQRAGTILH